MSSASPLAFVITQTKQNIDFLVLQGALTAEDGRQITRKLDLFSQHGLSSELSPAPTLCGATRSSSPMSNGEKALPSDPPVYTETSIHDPMSRHATSSPASHLFTAKARWAYNADNKESTDLTFEAGDTIHVLEETNADWWLGRCKGREGLFPSGYVERLKTPSPEPLHHRHPPPPPSHRASLYEQHRGPSPSFPTPGSSSSTKNPSYPQWHNPGYPPAQNQLASAQHQSYYSPSYTAPEPYGPYPGGSDPQVQHPEQAPKKNGNKFDGKLGSTLAQSAAGGVGFGAGSAIGSGIIHSIF